MSIVILFIAFLGGGSHVHLAAKAELANSTRAAAAVVRVAAPEQALPGDSIVIFLDLANPSDNVGAFQLELSFDPNVVGFQGADRGEFLGSTGRSVRCASAEVSAGAVRFACGSTGAANGPAGSGALAQFTFLAVGPGQTVLAVNDLQLVNDNSNPSLIPASTESAALTVNAVTAPATATPERHDLYLPSLQKGVQGLRSRATDSQIFVPSVEGGQQ